MATFYVADFANNAVKEIPAGCATSTCVTVLGGGFSEPAGVALDMSGNVYVADFGDNAVKEIPVGCTISTCVRTLGDGGFYAPVGVALDSSGNIYIGDNGNALKEMPSGCASSACVTTLDSSFNGPTRVAVDGSDDVYVADTGNNAVEEIITHGVNFNTVAAGTTSATRTLTFTFDSAGSIEAPAVLTQGAAGLDFADAGTGTCTTNGSVLKETLSSGSYSQSTVASSLTSPGGLAVDGSGNVYVAYGASVLKETLSDGSYTQGTLVNGLSDAVGVAVDGGGNVYIMDNGSGSVLIGDAVEWHLHSEHASQRIDQCHRRGGEWRRQRLYLGERR